MKKRIQVDGAKVLVMGLTFKENCPDLRNTRVVDIVTELKDYRCSVDIYDPWVSIDEAQSEYGITLIDQPIKAGYDAVVIAVAHLQFKSEGSSAVRALCKKNGLIYDLKFVLDKGCSDIRL